MVNTVVFVANTVVFEANTVVFEANTVVIWSKNSDILGTQWLFGKIQWFLGANTAVFSETHWYL